MSYPLSFSLFLPDIQSYLLSDYNGNTPIKDLFRFLLSDVPHPETLPNVFFLPCSVLSHRSGYRLHGLSGQDTQ